MTPSRAYFAILLTSALVAATALHASDIAGKVVLSGSPAAEVVISIEGLNLAQEPDLTIHILDHRNLDFVPHVLIIRPGAKVRFENSDGMPCHIYSISPAGTFALPAGDYQPATITFDQPGVIVIRCADHSRIYAFIIVRENPFYAITDRRGRYRLSGVPPGHYTLQAWYEGAVIESRPILLSGKLLKMDFRANRPRPAVEGNEPGNGITPSVAGGEDAESVTPVTSTGECNHGHSLSDGSSWNQQHVDAGQVGRLLVSRFQSTFDDNLLALWRKVK